MDLGVVGKDPGRNIGLDGVRLPRGPELFAKLKIFVGNVIPIVVFG
jgi:hypothetical protein